MFYGIVQGMKVLVPTKQPDLEKERSEKKYTLADFSALYNENLPKSFPQATPTNLKVFKKTYPDLFKDGDCTWSLDRHRKKLMDWLPQHIKNLERAV